MTAFFLRVLNMSLSGALVIAVLLPVRLLLRRAPKKWSYLLWSVAGFRLACPVSVPAAFSLFRLARVPTELPRAAGQASVLQTLPAGVTVAAAPDLSVARDRWAAANAYAGSIPPKAMAALPNQTHSWLTVALIVWLLGLAALLLWGVFSDVRLRRGLTGAVRLRENIYESDAIRAPFLLGLFRPRVYLPVGLDGETLDYVLTHERCHIRRGDHWVKLLAFLLLAVHWFNPMVWLAFRLLGRDMEMSCDEWVLRELGGGSKAYSRSLLSFAVDRRFPSPGPLAFGESDVKRRILNVLNWKKPSIWATLAAVVLCAAVAAACGTNPPGVGETERIPGEPALQDRSAAPADAGGGAVYTDLESYVEQRIPRAVEEDGVWSRSDAVQVTGSQFDLWQTGSLEGLAPEGTLESWRYGFRARLDGVDADMTIPGGARMEDGWYHPDGDRDLVALRRSDGSYQVLYDNPINDGMSFYGYHTSYEEAIWDWYVQANGLDYPLYVQDWGPELPEVRGNYPVHRYDGDGWYLYVPVTAWEKMNYADDWFSLYGTGSALTVRRATAEEAEADRPVPEEGQALRYVPAGDGSYWKLFTSCQNLDDSAGTDNPMIAAEPRALERMAESFTVIGAPAESFPGELPRVGMTEPLPTAASVRRSPAWSAL